MRSTLLSKEDSVATNNLERKFVLARFDWLVSCDGLSANAKHVASPSLAQATIFLHREYAWREHVRLKLVVRICYATVLSLAWAEGEHSVLF
jgi:hypothetical protein